MAPAPRPTTADGVAGVPLGVRRSSPTQRCRVDVLDEATTRRHEGGRRVKRFAGRSVVIVGLCAAIAAVAVSGAGAGGATKSAGIQACGLLPDTKTSVRWEQFDKPALIKAFKAAGVTARVVNAQGDPQKQK